MSDWPPQKKLPPGYPLAPVDESGHTIAVGATVRIVSVASAAQGLTPEERSRVQSCEGKTLQVREIDRYGMVWFDIEGTTVRFSLKPREVAVV